MNGCYRRVAAWLAIVIGCGLNPGESAIGAVSEAASVPPSTEGAAPVLRDASAREPNAAPAPLAAADIEGACAALAGVWQSREEGFAETTWSAPADGRMLGMFRWHRADGSVIVYEVLSIEVPAANDEDPRPLLMLRHLNAALNPWASEADGPMRFRLSAIERPEPGVTELTWTATGATASRVERIEHRVVRSAQPDGGGAGVEEERESHSGAGPDVLRTRVVFPAASSRLPIQLDMTRS